MTIVCPKCGAGLEIPKEMVNARQRHHYWMG